MYACTSTRHPFPVSTPHLLKLLVCALRIFGTISQFLISNRICFSLHASELEGRWSWQLNLRVSVLFRKTGRMCERESDWTVAGTAGSLVSSFYILTLIRTSTKTRMRKDERKKSRMGWHEYVWIIGSWMIIFKTWHSSGDENNGWIE
jgi:hypothetical protein